MLDSNAVLAAATVVLAVGTVLLAIATIVYAYAARATVVEMRLTRADAIRPILVLTPEFLGANFAIARLSNVGLGAARNIRGTIRRSENGVPPRQHEVRVAMLLPKAQHEFFLDINEDERHEAQSAQDMVEEVRLGRDHSIEVVVRRPYRELVFAAYGQGRQSDVGRLELRADAFLPAQRHLALVS